MSFQEELANDQAVNVNMMNSHLLFHHHSIFLYLLVVQELSVDLSSLSDHEDLQHTSQSGSAKVWTTKQRKLIALLNLYS